MSIFRCAAIIAAAGLFALPSVAGETITYTYDPLGRLIAVERAGTVNNGVDTTYVYDEADNRLTRATFIPGAPAPPHAVNDTATVAASQYVDIQVRANDTDPNGDPLTITLVSTPTAGTATIMSSGTYVRYTAPATTGVQTFNYTISDGNNGTDTATVTVTVTAPPNTPPNAVNDYYQTTNTSFLANVRANDTDADGHALTLTAVTQPTNGASAAIQSGNVSVTSLPIGVTTFNYTISDGNGGTDTATVSITRELGGMCGGPGQPICP